MSKRRKNKDSNHQFTFKFKPLTEGQQYYYNALNDHDLNYLAISGPSGTGKTVLAMQRAAADLIEGRINKIYLATSVTPIAGESIGYLKGGVNEKLSSWMLPMTDHLSKFIPDHAKRGDIEYISLAQIRGRDIKNSILIIDEAQNLSFDVLKASITRLCGDSRLFLLGDFKQSDKGKYTDFEKLCKKLSTLDCFKWVELYREDIVRSEHLGEIIELLEELEEEIFEDKKPLKYF